MSLSFSRLGRKVAAAAAGMVAAIVIWSFTGSDVEAERLERLPSAVFGGGAGTLRVEAQINQPGYLVASFERYDPARWETEELINVEQALAVGSHSFDVDIAAATSTYLEVGIPGATPGARIDWRVSLDGEEALAESERLAEPLGEGHAFFVELECESIEHLRAALRSRR